MTKSAKKLFCQPLPQIKKYPYSLEDFSFIKKKLNSEHLDMHNKQHS